MILVTMYLEMAKKLIAEGDEDRARGIIIAHRQDPCDNPELHFEWGLLCEEISAFNPACKSYEEAVKLDPRNSKYLYQLARLYADAGRHEKALSYATQAVKQDGNHSPARSLLAELLEAMGHKGSAQAVRKQESAESSPLRYFPPSISKADLDTFMRLFSGRELVYAIQQLAQNTGRPQWIYHDGPVTPEVVEQHIEGGATLGGLALRSDNAVKYAAIHIRIYDRALLQYLKTPSALVQLEEMAEQQAQRVVALCAEQGISAYLEDPGLRDRRVWFFFDRFLHFLLIRRFLNRIMESVPLLDSRLVVEPILPTQPVGIGWQEQAIFLPLGIDLRTGRRSLFKDADGLPFPEQLKFIRKIRELDETNVRAAFRRNEIRFSRADAGISGTKDVKELLDHCPVITELIKKAESGRKLNSNEKLIIFHSLGLSAKTRISVHNILYACPDYDYKKVEQILARLKPHPISCIKIRALIPDITASLNCFCTFDLRGGRYPSPFLHIEPQTPLCTAEEDLANSSIKHLAGKYLLQLAKAEEMRQDLKKLETAIGNQMARKAINSVSTPHGTLRLVIDGANPVLVVER